MQIIEGETLFLVGESGCGKTTLLKTLCQLLPYHNGEIKICGQELKDIPPRVYKKRIGYVIQKAGLLPHLNIRKNIQLPARIHKLDDQVDQRTYKLLEFLNLEASLLDKYPHQISGGQKQRVGIARALINDPEILFMDEPFGALDPLTKKRIYKDFLSLKRFLNKTVIIVSHDMNEASILADRITILREGRFEHTGTYEELRHQTQNQYVQDFMKDWKFD